MRREGVTLEALIAEVPELDASLVGGSAVVVDLHHDSRDVTPGSGFIAVRGARHDGHASLPDAVRRGATAVVVDHRVDAAVPQVVVTDTRRAMPWMAAAVHGHPSRSLTVVGVTGTNGKTTVTHMLESIARKAKRRCALVGTIGARIGDTDLPVARTTPEATDLQRLLGAMRDDGVDIVALEVSSHAMTLHRADAIEFAVVAFTNLSQDHLDFHLDMDSYFAAKRSLFTKARAAAAVVWVDDPRGAEIASWTDLDTTTVGFSADADVTAESVQLGVHGSRFVVRSGTERIEVELPLPGRFNVANALVALACSGRVGIAAGVAASGLAALDQVPGRFESIVSGQPFAVIVDYAHTPQAIASVIAEARMLTGGRVIVVFGAGGDRDRRKRPLMGAAAESADVVYVTSDNPRSEDPGAIVDEIRAGMTGDHHREIDRRAAIAGAVGSAAPGDVVLVLGRGHESHQEVAGGAQLPFDDRDEARRALAAVGWAP